MRNPIGRPCTTLHDELNELPRDGRRAFMLPITTVRSIANSVARAHLKTFSVVTLNERVTLVRRVN